MKYEPYKRKSLNRITEKYISFNFAAAHLMKSYRYSTLFDGQPKAAIILRTSLYLMIVIN